MLVFGGRTIGVVRSSAWLPTGGRKDIGLTPSTAMFSLCFIVLVACCATVVVSCDIHERERATGSTQPFKTSHDLQQWLDHISWPDRHV